MRYGLATAVLTIGLLAACGDDGEPTATERACDTWNDLLATEPAPSDDAVAAELRAIDLDGVDDDVAGAVVAVASRLEDGSDVSGAFDRLSDLCT